MAAGKGIERSGVAVVVPTTAGAIQVLGLRWSQRIPSSRVVLGNETSDQCERWTKDYNSLLRSGDPMRMLLGLPEGGGCRLVVSAEIDHGRSWIVPIAAAHFADARAQAVHADVARARMLIWGTGAIDFSQPETADQARIVENDYHLTSKIDLSREHFAAAAHDGTPVLCLLPAGGDAERAAGILKRILGQQPHHVEIVHALADIIRPIDAFLGKGNFNAPPDMKYAPIPYTPPPESPSEDDAPPRAAAPPPRSETPPVQPSPVQPPPGAPPFSRGKTGPAPGAGAGAEMPVSAASMPSPRGGLSMGVLGGIAAVLVAIIGAGGLMWRNSITPAAVETPLQPQAVAPPSRPQVVSVPVQPPSPAGSSLAAPPVAAPVPPVDPATAVGRLTVLTPPAGSSCQSQVLEMNPRFVETVVELSGGQPVVEIDSGAICGLAISGSGSVQSRFAQGTVVGIVPSLSSASRIVFNPSSAGGRLPDVAVTGGAVEKIELRRK
jgi:hypothetical protein